MKVEVKVGEMEGGEVGEQSDDHIHTSVCDMSQQSSLHVNDHICTSVAMRLITCKQSHTCKCV